MPAPRCDQEGQQEYVRRFMKSAEAKRDYPDPEQRAAVAHSWYRQKCGGGSKLKRVRAG